MPELHPYVKAVEEFITQSRFDISTEPVLRLVAVSPLLYIEANRIQLIYIDVKETYDELIKRKFDRLTYPYLQSRNVVGELDMKYTALRYTVCVGEDNALEGFGPYVGRLVWNCRSCHRPHSIDEHKSEYSRVHIASDSEELLH